MDYIIPWKEQQIGPIELIKLYQFERFDLQIKICNEAFQIGVKIRILHKSK